MDTKALEASGFAIAPLPPGMLEELPWGMYIHPISGKQVRLPNDKRTKKDLIARGFKPI